VLVPRRLEEFDGVPVSMVSVGPGGYHTVVLTARGQVYTWGHNRVGQLGHGHQVNLPRNADGAFFLPKPRLVDLEDIGEKIVQVRFRFIYLWHYLFHCRSQCFFIVWVIRFFFLVVVVLLPLPLTLTLR
jgi:hypothetical protein